MYNSCCLRGFHSFLECPSTTFLRACSKEGLKVQQLVGGFYQAVHATLLQPQVFKKHLFLLVGLQLGNVRLDAGTYHKHLSALILHGLSYRVDIFVSCHHRCFVNIAHIQYRFSCQQHQILCCLLLALVQLHRAGALATQQRIAIQVHHLHQFLRFGVATGFGLLYLFLVAVLDGFKVLELQFEVNGLFVANGVHAPVDMRHIVVVKAAQHMDDGIRCADVCQELVAQTLAL